MITRSAVLIGSVSGDMRDIQQDIEDWKNFLSSSIGGGWLISDEIRIIQSASREAVISAINAASKSDYALIVFSGHGETRRDRLGFPETHLHLDDTTTVSEVELNPRTMRCSMFFDSPRASKLRAESSLSVKPSTEEVLRASRSTYESIIMQAEAGCTKVYAADLSASAKEKNSFSQIILRKSLEWSQRNIGNLNIQQAIEITNGYFDGEGLQQKPRYQGGRRMRHFPFAVSQ